MTFYAARPLVRSTARPLRLAFLLWVSDLGREQRRSRFWRSQKGGRLFVSILFGDRAVWSPGVS